MNRGHDETKDRAMRRPILPAAMRVATQSVLVVLGFTILLSYFYPMVLTLSWYLRNGRFVIYKGRTIPVPLRWTVKIEPQDTMLMKLHWTVFARPPTRSWILFHPSPYQTISNRDDAVKSWEALYWTRVARTNDVVSGPLTIRSARNETLCMKSISKGNPEVASADCLIFQPIVDAHFGGERKDFDTFLQILSEMK